MNCKNMQSLPSKNQELALRQVVPAATIPLTYPAQEAKPLLPKMTVDNDVEVYLAMFEHTAHCKDWDPWDWAWLLMPLLVGEAQ